MAKWGRNKLEFLEALCLPDGEKMQNFNAQDFSNAFCVMPTMSFDKLEIVKVPPMVAVGKIRDFNAHCLADEFCDKRGRSLSLENVAEQSFLKNAKPSVRTKFS